MGQGDPSIYKAANRLEETYLSSFQLLLICTVAVVKRNCWFFTHPWMETCLWKKDVCGENCLWKKGRNRLEVERGITGEPHLLQTYGTEPESRAALKRGNQEHQTGRVRIEIAIEQWRNPLVQCFTLIACMKKIRV